MSESSEDVPSKEADLLPGQEEIKPMPRIHESDKSGDVKELNRQGERNLYLLVHGKDSSGKQVWRFPQGGLKEDEALHQVSSLSTLLFRTKIVRWASNLSEGYQISLEMFLPKKRLLWAIFPSAWQVHSLVELSLHMLKPRG